MYVEVDRQKCSGHAMCVMAGPDAYVLGDDGYNATPPGEVPEQLQDQAVRGAEACPERAITVTS